MAAVSTKAVVVLLAAVLVALVAGSAAVRVREEDVVLGSLAPAPAPALTSAAGAVAPGAWAVAAVVSLIAFLAH